MNKMSMSEKTFTPTDEVMTTIVLPTIAFCVGLIVAMLIGINKCKQWELDKIVEMRRTRRVVQRITARLREKNFRTIQKARIMRKQAAAAAAKEKTDESPPLYSYQLRGSTGCGRSPPPSYEDALLDEYYQECKPVTSSRRESAVSTKYPKQRRRSSTHLNSTKVRRTSARNPSYHV